MTPNQKAFLDMLAHSEGTSTNPATKNNGYDVIVTGIDGKPEIFTDYSNHPFASRKPKTINRNGLKSTASGRHQFLVHDWAHYRSLLGLQDFGPASQDKWAMQLIRERGALAAIDAGDFATAVMKCRNIWASLPGAGYPGQHMKKLADLQAAYVNAGGQLS